MGKVDCYKESDLIQSSRPQSPDSLLSSKLGVLSSVMATSATNSEQQAIEPLPENSEAKQMPSVLRPPTLHLQSLGAWEAARTCGGRGRTERESLLSFVVLWGTTEPREPEQGLGAAGSYGQAIDAFSAPLHPSIGWSVFLSPSLNYSCPPRSGFEDLMPGPRGLFQTASRKSPSMQLLSKDLRARELKDTEKKSDGASWVFNKIQMGEGWEQGQGLISVW